MRRDIVSCACNMYLLVNRFRVLNNIKIVISCYIFRNNQENTFSDNEERRREGERERERERKNSVTLVLVYFYLFESFLESIQARITNWNRRLQNWRPRHNTKGDKLVILVSTWTMGAEGTILCLPLRQFSAKFGFLNATFFSSHYSVRCVHKCGSYYHHLV